MALTNRNDGKNGILQILQSTSKAYSNLASGVLAVGNLKKVTTILEYVICDLSKERKKYEKLIKMLTNLASDYQKLEIETKAHVRTVKEQASFHSNIFKRAKQQSMNGENFMILIVEIEQSAQDSLKSCQSLQKNYNEISGKVKNYSGQAKAGKERNEKKANASIKGCRVGLVSGLGIGGVIGAFQVATKTLCVFGPMGAVAGGVLGFVGGAVIAGMAGALPFATMEHLYRKYAGNFETIDHTLCEINKVFMENFYALTEICRLLRKLGEESKYLMMDQDEVDNADGNDTSNLDFLIALRFEELERISKDLEGNCQYVLDDMPLAALEGTIDKKMS